MMRLQTPQILLAVCLFLVIPSSAQSLVHRELGRSLDALLDDEPFENAFWGAVVMDARTGELLYERYADKSFVPASNAKLYSTAAALAVLGPTFTYQTDLYARGTPIHGLLEGDLIIRGAGDPAFGGRFHDGDRLYVFRTWADSLRAAGISRISGDIIGDASIFDDVPLGRGWNWDDEPYWYAAEISGLSFNDNTVDFTLAARSTGQPAMISWEPGGTGYVSVQNFTTTIPGDSSLIQRYSRARGTNEVVFETRLPVGRSIEPSVSVTDPAHYAAYVFLEELRRQGINVDGRARSLSRRDPGIDYSTHELSRIARYTSPPLGKIIDVINKRSQNLYAEQVLRTIGALAPLQESAARRGSTLMGLERSRHVWGGAGVDTTRIRLVDASGLSRHNLVTPRMTANLLHHMWHHPDPAVREVFVSSLPVGGIDGTLSGRFRAGTARGNVRAKTGTLSGASALAGYVRNRRGNELIFVLMANHFTASAAEARRAQDSFVNRIVSW